MKEVTIYTDGACKNNPGKGGYGAILIFNNNKKEILGFEENSTNNRMEMTAVIKSLKLLKQPCKVNLFSDSKLIVNTMNNNWKKNKNLDLWEEINSLNKIHKISWNWVKAHSTNELNNRADELANLAIIKNSN